MTGFLFAAIALLALLVLVLLASCAHLLARIIRLEGAARPVTIAPSASPALGASAPVRVGAVLPDDVQRDLSLPGTGSRSFLYVVSAGCASCRPVAEWLCRHAPRSRVDRRLVVAHPADIALLPLSCSVPIVVSSALVRAIVEAGRRLPVTVTVEDGRIIAVDRTEPAGIADE